MKHCQKCSKEIPGYLKLCLDCARGSNKGATAADLKKFVFWWVMDPQELRKQVGEYYTLKINQSARGVSMLCLLFSAVLTAIFALAHLTSLFSLVDAAVMAVIAFCIYRGQRWASIAALILWTAERLLGLVALPDGDASVGPAIASLLWWAAFMRPFWFAFKIEQERLHPTITATEPD